MLSSLIGYDKNLNIKYCEEKYVGTNLQSITTREVVEFTATSTDLTLMITLSAGNYGRLAHIDNLEIAEIAEIGEGYNYGFNGMENDNETYGTGNTLDFGARIYDSRLGRWLSEDQLETKYPDLSPFNFVGNSPLDHIDPDGKVIKPASSQFERVFVARLDDLIAGKNSRHQKAVQHMALVRLTQQLSLMLPMGPVIRKSKDQMKE